MPELYERLLIMSNGADFGSNRQGEHGLTRSPSSGGAATDPDPCHSHPAKGSPACRERGRTLVREAPLRAIGTRKVPRRAADRIRYRRLRSLAVEGCPTTRRPLFSDSQVIVRAGATRAPVGSQLGPHRTRCGKGPLTGKG